MASIVHIAVGMAAGRWLSGRRSVVAMLSMATLSMLPDADVIAFALGIPYLHEFGHRGATHSLVFAVGVGVVVGLAVRLKGGRALRVGVLSAVVVASHPLLDAMTTGGEGVALWWPMHNDRIFFGWRPIPVAPIGLNFFSASGARVAMAELWPSLPLVVYALWRNPRH